ncbi:snaclec alboaggregin-B subunit alpha-like [Stegastes partitus]|uniref:Snaclec alboaggregin-B subunit alpha-like n=1 Tax=Stegastes partitus TaxID=144197 RepID=A0A9Y4N8J0_9TELE|nr:PREDICTED: snaclec alboaggregin-B subunit alpha-like [Stegastes partitus]
MSLPLQLFTDPLNSPGNCACRCGPGEKWGVYDCGAGRSFMCSDEKLILVKESKTWEEALEHCRSLEILDPNVATAPYRNYRYDLATLISQDDHTKAREKAQEADSQSVWTGLRHLAGQWMWVSGEPVTYETILTCPQSKACGVMPKEGNETFSIRECHQRRNFLCSRRP